MGQVEMLPYWFQYLLTETRHKMKKNIRTTDISIKLNFQSFGLLSTLCDVAVRFPLTFAIDPSALIAPSKTSSFKLVLIA